MELYIIRHGQSTNNALEDSTQRSFDPDLTPAGQQQAERVAAYLADGSHRDPWMSPGIGFTHSDAEQTFGITHLYTSAMHRAMLTAAPIARALNLKPQIWLDIHEHGGLFLEHEGVVTGYPGMTRQQIGASFPEYVIPDGVTDQGWYDPAGGQESLTRCYGRAMTVAEELRRRARAEDADARIALVTHGTFIDALIKALFNLLPSRHMFFFHYNTAITRIDFVEKGRIYVRHVNRIDHLPADLVT